MRGDRAAGSDATDSTRVATLVVTTTRRILRRCRSTLDRLVIGRVVFGAAVLHTRRAFRLAVTVGDLGGRGVVGARVQAVPLLGYARVTATGVTARRASSAYVSCRRGSCRSAAGSC